MVLLVVVDSPRTCSPELPASVVPGRSAALVPLAARGLGRGPWDRRIRRRLRAGAGPLEDYPQIVNPYGVHSPVLKVVGAAGAIVAGSSMVASAISLIVRMRRAGGEERRQIKWLAYGGAVVVGSICVSGLISLWSTVASIVIIAIALLGLSVFTGVAIVKHRLYEMLALPVSLQVYSSLAIR